MNPAQLLSHFDRISDAPDAIPRLRRFILDLAVRGKLVDQDARDEPASELLKKIHGNRAQLIKNRGLHGKPDEIWPIPSRWVFVPLELIAMPNGLFTDGDWVESKDQDPNGDVRLIQLADVGMGEYRNRSSRFMNSATAARLNCTFLKIGDILIARMPDPLGRACIFPGDPKPCVTVVDVAVLRLGNQEFNGTYVVHAINSPQFGGNVQSKAAGTTRSRISRGNLSALPFPFPPLAEQHRIVAKVEELMALCDRLEAAQVERENRRDRLVASSLNRLNNGADASTFHDHARFYFNHLPRLTTKPEHIQQLRQTILNLAVRGKLVPQDPNDEPAKVLLAKVEANAKAYALEEDITPPSSDPIAKEDIDYSAPSGWEWVRLASLFKVITDGDHQPPPKTSDGIAFLTIGNITTGKLDFTNCRFVGEEYWKSLRPYRKPESGDILYTVIGATYGRPVHVDTHRHFCVQRHIAILKPTDQMNILFLCLLLASPLVYRQATHSITGTAQPTIALRPLRNFLVPLPPLAEQQRIVAKVEELMALCDKLEAQLTTTHTDSRRLLEAVLYEALTPTRKEAV